jgi:hypothetical protein
MIHVAPLVERIRTEAGSLDRLKELLGDDGVGIDVGAIEWRNQAVELDELFHYLADFSMADVLADAGQVLQADSQASMR